MNKDNKLITSFQALGNGSHKTAMPPSLQDTTGASAKQIRKAIEQMGFDREKVEQYLLSNKKYDD